MATTFQSLTNAQDAFSTKHGKEFRASVMGFAAKDAEVAAAGSRFAVKTFMNLSGSKDLLNEKLGLSLDEKSYERKNGEVIYSIPANFTVWTYTSEEADALAKELRKGRSISSPVRVSAREYNGKIYVEMNADGVFVKDGGSSSAAPAAGAAKVDNGKPMELSDDDLPF